MNNELGISNLSGQTGANNGSYDKELAATWITDLYHRTKAQDPSRMCGFTACRTTFIKDGSNINWEPYATVDWCSENMYGAWYNTGGTISSGIAGTINSGYTKIPHYAVSEYGAGANPMTHSMAATATTNNGSGGTRHDEEWQSMAHEAFYADIKDADNKLYASSVWVLFDFYVSGRREGGIEYTNDKGLVTRDRSIKKDAYYFYRAVWNKNLTMHICEEHYANRTWPIAEIKVYSNASYLNLYKVNPEGEDVLIQTLNRDLATHSSTSNVVWKFNDVTLTSGANEFYLTGECNGITEESDHVYWTYTPSTLTVNPVNFEVNTPITPNVSMPCFTVEVSGGTPPYSYYWQWFNPAIVPSYFEKCSLDQGGATNTFQLTVRTTENLGYKYRCYVEDAAGNVAFSPTTTLVNADDVASKDYWNLTNNVGYIPLEGWDATNYTIYLELADGAEHAYNTITSAKSNYKNTPCVVTTKGIGDDGLGMSTFAIHSGGSVGAVFRGHNLGSSNQLRTNVTRYWWSNEADKQTISITNSPYNKILINATGGLTDKGSLIRTSPRAGVIPAHRGYVYFNHLTDEINVLPYTEPNLDEYATNDALRAAIDNNIIHPTTSGAHIVRYVFFAHATYNTIEDVLAHRTEAEIDIEVDEDGFPYNAGTSGDLIYSTFNN